MPKRSNEFQTLIRLIEQQLAPQGAKGSESELVADLFSGLEREGDIHIEVPVGVHSIRIGVETRDRVRPASVEWIDELIGRYTNLPIDGIVAVSRSGFYRPAK